jgi:hypothetical protein
MNVAERTERARTRLRTITDRLMRMTSVFPATRNIEPTPNELAELERRDEVPLPTSEPEEQLDDQQHPLVSRLEHGHPKL